MAKRPDLTKLLDTGAQFLALTRAQARARAKELVGTGQLARGQVQEFVDDLVEESRRRTDEMLGLVRGEIQRQVKSLGLATKDDLARLEARLSAGGVAEPKQKASAKKTKSKPKTTKKTAKSGAKKSKKAKASKTTKGSASSKSAARSAAARKSSRGSGSS